MSYPNINNYGLNNNPLVFTPFVENNYPGDGGELPSNLFILLDLEDFLLLDGGFFLLLGS